MTAVYKPSTYNGLPVLEEAGARFDKMNGDAVVEDFRYLFVKHNLDRVFGLILNHRHFDMDPEERLVEYQGTSVPWIGMTEKIIPSTWLLTEDNKVLPYEFHYSPHKHLGNDNDTPDNPKYSEFIQAFNEILRRNDVAGLFGLCQYPGDDFKGRTEITKGRANINLDPEDAPANIPARAAAWYFSPKLVGKCHCVCGGDGHTSADHKGHATGR